MRLMRYKPGAEFVSGKTLVVADTLSRSPNTHTREETDIHSDVACYVATVKQEIPKVDSIRMVTATASEPQSVIKLLRTGWHEYTSNVPMNAGEYLKVKNELSEYDGLITRGCRIVVLRPMRADILQKLHDGHQGLKKV